MKKQKYNIRMWNTETVEVSGYRVYRYFGLRYSTSKDIWAIDHLPTGACIVETSWATLKSIKEFAKFLANTSGIPWETSSIEKIKGTMVVMEELRDAVREFGRWGTYAPNSKDQ